MCFQLCYSCVILSYMVNLYILHRKVINMECNCNLVKWGFNTGGIVHTFSEDYDVPVIENMLEIIQFTI